MAAASLQGAAIPFSNRCVSGGEAECSSRAEVPCRSGRAAVESRRCRQGQESCQLNAKHHNTGAKARDVSCAVALAERSTTTRQPRQCSLLNCDDAVLCCVQGDANVLHTELGTSNIYLIGMMGCGKSTVGRLLAEVLGYDFVDSDSLVEEAAGMSIPDIFAIHGEATFRELETQAISRLASMGRLIVATGGGAVLRPCNWDIMKAGVVAWLDVPLEDLAARVVAAGVKSRPILSQGAENEDAYTSALARLSSVWEKRKHLYLSAEVRVSLKDMADLLGRNVKEISAPRIAGEIVQKVRDLLETRQMLDEISRGAWMDGESCDRDMVTYN